MNVLAQTRPRIGSRLDFDPERTQPIERRKKTRAEARDYRRPLGVDRRSSAESLGALALKLDLVRSVPTLFTQPGTLFRGVEQLCFTLEEGTIFTPGIYELRNMYSAAMRMYLPGVWSPSANSDLLGYIHPGTPHHESHRHIKVGYDRRLDLIVDSRAAFARVYDLIDDARKSFDEKVILEIKA
jgi:hypothetical protein